MNGMILFMNGMMLFMNGMMLFTVLQTGRCFLKNYSENVRNVGYI
jgi:hypothetical protein